MVSMLFWFSLFGASLMKLFAVSKDCKCVVLADKHINLKLE